MATSPKKFRFVGIEHNQNANGLLFARSRSTALLDRYGNAVWDDKSGSFNMPINEGGVNYTDRVTLTVDETQIIDKGYMVQANTREMVACYRTPAIDGNLFADGKANVAVWCEMSWLQDGVIYTIDDLWLYVGSDLNFITNWMDYRGVDMSKPGQSVEFLAWRGFDKSSRCVVEFVSDVVDASGYIQIKVKYKRELELGTSEASGIAFDEFNIQVADMIRADTMSLAAQGIGGNSDSDGLLEEIKHIDFRPMISNAVDKTILPGYVVIPMLKEYGVSNLESASIEIDPKTLRASYNCDYSSTTVMDNNSTENMTFKTPDYTHKHTDTTSIQTAITGKFTMGLSFKGSEKTTADVKTPVFEGKEEITVENTLTFGFELSATRTTTETHSDEKTYTCPGQTVVVPAGKSYQASCVWKKGAIQGHIDTFYPLVKDPSLHLMYKILAWTNTATSDVKSTLDVAKMESIFGTKLPSLQIVVPKQTKGLLQAGAPTPCVRQRFPFLSDAGILSEFSVKETGKDL